MKLIVAGFDETGFCLIVATDRWKAISFLDTLALFYNTNFSDEFFVKLLVKIVVKICKICGFNG